jgi:hypothetical protein
VGIVGLGLMLVGFLPSLASAAETRASASLVVGDLGTWVIPVELTEGGYQIVPNSEDGFFVIEETEFTFEAKGSGDIDPQLTFGLVAFNFSGGLLPFTFTFTGPAIVPAGPTIVRSSLAGALTDATGNGVAIAPIVGTNIMINNVTAPLTNMGVDLGPAASHPPAVPTTYTYGAFNAGFIPGPPGPWTGLSTTVQFTLTGSGDFAVLGGLSEIQAVVPEPSTVVLGAIGLIVVVGRYGLRRRRSAA